MIVAFGFAALLASSAPASAGGTPIVGTVAAMRGAATATASGGAPPVSLSVGAELHDGDDIRTGPESRLKLALRDGSALSLGANTEFKIDHLATDAAAPSKFTQLSGFVRAVVAPVNAASGFEIQTPSMVAAVRGTDWIQNFADDVTEIFVVRGRVLTSGVAAHAADQVELSPGEGVSFSASTGPTPVARWKQAKIDLFVAATSAP
jgi:hypothetical protein